MWRLLHVLPCITVHHLRASGALTTDEPLDPVVVARTPPRWALVLFATHERSVSVISEETRLCCPQFNNHNNSVFMGALVQYWALLRNCSLFYQ